MSKLTTLQQEFLKQLFGPCSGDLKLAAKAVEVDDYSVLMTSEMLLALRERADNEIAFNVPKAIFVMQKILHNPESTMNMAALTKLCSEFLDRAGLGKVERGGSGGLKIGLVILPDKTPIKEAEYEVIDNTSGERQVQGGSISMLSPTLQAPEPAPVSAV